MSVLEIHAQPSRTTSWMLSWFLFATGILAYFWASTDRHRDNPDDRVMPTLHQMGKAFADAVMKPAQDAEVAVDADQQTTFTKIRNGMLWKDTKATGRRFLLSLGLLVPSGIARIALYGGCFRMSGTFFTCDSYYFSTKIVALVPAADSVYRLRD